MNGIEETIRQKAAQLGYERCGIVGIEALAGYDEKLEERMSALPATKMFYENQKRLTKLSAQYPWAKSVVVAARPYHRYNVPAPLEGHIGKTYLFDPRAAITADEMDEFLQSLGLKTAANRLFGPVGLRWAAMKAGLGIVRRNNFFYTDSGSWVWLEAWITDGEMAYIEECSPPACPENCRRCMGACPTKALSGPYAMSPGACVSFMTTSAMNDFTHHPLAKQTGDWIYGCDACQDACPMNHGKWKGGTELPGLEDVAPLLTPEGILALDEVTYREKIQPRFFYLKPEELWKWKVNALNFMRNNYQEPYKKLILEACEDENTKVRGMAELIRAELFETAEAPVSDHP
jgi:epoxyqueuosine reductase